MTDSISFGKGKNAGKVDLTKVKDGLTKQQIAGNNKKLQSIFDKVDSNRNQVLEQDELLEFHKQLGELAGEDNQLTDKEAKEFKDANGKAIKGGRRKAFYEFLNKLAANEQEPQATQTTQAAQETQEIQQSQQPAPDPEQQTVLTATPGDILTEQTDDGAEEEFEVIILPDGSIKKAPYSRTENKGLPNQTTTFYNCDANGNVTQAFTTGDGKQVTTFYGEGVEYDKLGETKPEKQIIIDNKHTATVVTYNEQGNKIEAVYSNVSADVGEDEKLHVSFLDDEHKTTFTEYDSSNNRLAQTVEKDGKEYKVSYDGEGNTNITVQYRETPEAIADKFGCDINELIELNGGNRAAFATGAKIKVPGELEADSAVLQGRGTRAQEVKKQQNAKNASARRQHNAEIQKRTQAECNARTVVSHKIEDKLVYVKDQGWQSVYTFDLKTDKGILHYLYRQEGQNQATSSSFNARLKQLRDLNPGRFDKDGKLLEPDKPLNLPVAPALAQQWGAEVTRQNDRDIMYTEHDNASAGRGLAKNAYAAIAGAGTNVTNLSKAVNSLNQNNIVGFLDSYNASYGESFVKAIRGESKIKGHQEEANYLAKVKYSLLARSNALGLDHAAALNSITTQTPTKDIDKILNRVLSDIKSIEVLAPSERGAALARMKGELTHDDVKGMRDAGVENRKEADRILENQLKQDGFFGDLYEGLKWCVNSSQLDEKVKADINGFQKKLNAVVNKYNQNHNIEEFKAEFKAQFGVECDPQLLKQYTNLTDKIQISQNLDFVEKYFDNHERMSETQLRKLFADLQKENPNIFGEGVDINNLSKQDMNNIVNSIVNSLREQRGNSIAWTSDLVEARQTISRQLFGSQNDVIFRAMDYADSQRQGAGYLKMGTKIVAAIVGGALTGGIGGAALIAGATSLGIDVGDAEYRATVNGGEHMSLDEFGAAATEALTNAGMVLVGGAYYKYVEDIANLSKLAKAGMLTTLDLTSGAAVEKMMTGEITIEGTVFTALFSVAGHCIGLKPKGNGAGENPPPTPKPESETPVLSKAVKQQNADGSVSIADPSRVHVGEAKAENIAAEVEGLVTSENVAAQELAGARKELGGISNRELRREMQAKLDDKGQNLAGYEEQVRADQKALAEQIAGKREITPGDARAVKEYVENTNNIAELEELMGRFEPTRPGHRPTRKIVEDRINLLKQNARSNSEIQTEVHAALDKAIENNKGLSSLNDLKQHLSSTTDLSELNQLFDKWMKIRKNCGSNRKQIDALFKEKGFDISRPNQRPVTQPEAKIVADNAEPIVSVEEQPVVPHEEPEVVVKADDAEPVVRVEDAPEAGGVVVSDGEEIRLSSKADDAVEAEGVVISGDEEVKLRANADDAEVVMRAEEVPNRFNNKSLKEIAQDNTPISELSVDELVAKRDAIETLRANGEAKPQSFRGEDGVSVIHSDEYYQASKAIEQALNDKGVNVRPKDVATPENIARDAQAIPDAEIPAEHRSMWKSCQERIGKLFSTGKELAMGEVKTVLSDLKILYNAVKNVNVKKQIARLSKKIQAYAKSKPKVEDYKLPDNATLISDKNGVQIYRTEEWMGHCQEIEVITVNGRKLKSVERHLSHDRVTSTKNYTYDKNGQLTQAIKRDDTNIIIKNEIIDPDGVSIVYDCENGYVYADRQIAGGEDKSRRIGYELPLDKLRLAAAGKDPGITASNIAELGNLPEGRIKYGEQFQRVTTDEEADAVFRDFVQRKSRRTTMDNEDRFCIIETSEAKNAEFIMTDGWAKHYTNAEQGTPWKIHVYADSPTEWANAAQLCMPYLDKHGIDYKTISTFADLQALAVDTQRGKAFTIYFKDEAAFLQTAKDLDGIFSSSGLKSSGIVANDAQIGESGFLSYRNERSSRYGNYKPADAEDPYLNMIAKQKTETKPTGESQPRSTHIAEEELAVNSKDVVEPEPVTGKVDESDVVDLQESVLVDDEVILAEILSPHENLVFDIQEQLQCNEKLAEKLAAKMETTPEMLPHFEKLLKSGRDYSEINEIIRIATPDNIETLISLSKNKKLGIVYKVDGSISRNDFEIILKIADANPVNKTQLLDIAANSQRGQTDIYLISELMKKYPENVADITRLTKSNPNIKVGYDLNNNLSRNIDDIIAQMNNKPQLRNEILDFMSVQRRALNDTTDPARDLKVYIDLLENQPKNRRIITALAKDHNLTPYDISTLLKRYQNNPQALADIQGLAGKQFTADMIENKLKRIRKFPELRKIMLSDGPSYNLIDKTVVNTPVETIQQRFTIRENIEKFAADDLATLRTTLGDEFYPKVKWEEIIPTNATEKEIKAILADINENSKFFARTAGNERKYGKNIKWAAEMGDISRSAQTQIKNGESFDDVITSIANDYRAYDEASTFNSNAKLDDRREWSGIYRGNMGKQDGKFGATTGISDYPTYRERFHKMANQPRTYKGIELTTFGPYADRGPGLYMLHPTNQNIKPAMKLMKQNYKNLQPLVKKVQKGGTLTPEEINFAHQQIAESYYLMGNVMPWARGSNGISDLYMRSLYKSLNIEQPALKHGVSLDLEAFTMTMDEYKANWNTFFEDGTHPIVADDLEVEIIGFTPAETQNKKTQQTYIEPTPVENYNSTQNIQDINDLEVAAMFEEFEEFTPTQDFFEPDDPNWLDDIII